MNASPTFAKDRIISADILWFIAMFIVISVHCTEFTNGDNDPIRIILCSGKNEPSVKYATTGLPQQVFVSKYLINLPSEEELQKIIAEEKEKDYSFKFV